jgi:hypothetical protein
MLDTFHSLAPAAVRFTVSVFGEGISVHLLRKLRTEFIRLNLAVQIYSVAFEPNVQVLFNEDFDDDAVIFADAEQSRSGSEFAIPEATCYVVAQNLPAYRVSYYAPKDSQSPRDVLLDCVREWSHLSWLSVKPGSEKRTISYPLQIVGLIRKSRPLTAHISRYEFLPSADRI